MADEPKQVEEDYPYQGAGAVSRRNADTKPYPMRATCPHCAETLVYQNRLEFVCNVQDPIFGGSGYSETPIYREVPEVKCPKCCALYSLELWIKEQEEDREEYRKQQESQARELLEKLRSIPGIEIICLRSP